MHTCMLCGLVGTTKLWAGIRRQQKMYVTSYNSQRLEQSVGKVRTHNKHYYTLAHFCPDESLKTFP